MRAAEPAAWEWDVIDDCSDLSSWTISNNNADRYAEENTEFVRTGDASIRIRCNASASAGTITLIKNFNFSLSQDDRLFAAVYLPFDPVGQASGFSCRGGDALNNGAGIKWKREMDANHHHYERVGWMLFPFSFSDIVAESGTPAQGTQYQCWRFVLTASPSTNREVIVDSVGRYRARPTVIFQFDDGRDSAYTEGFAYAHAAGIPLTHQLIASRLDQSTFVTTAQAREMMAAGDEIGSHGDRESGTDSWGDVPQNIVTDTEAIEAVMGVKMRTGAYPQGNYGEGAAQTFETVFEKCAEAGLESCRTTQTSGMYSGFQSPYTLCYGANMGSGTSLAQAKAAIDRAVKYGGACIIAGHKLAATAADTITWAIADWQALIDYVVLLRQQGLIRTMTTSQWHKEAQRGTRLRAA